MSMYQQTLNHLQAVRQTWLKTGVAGFIGNALLRLNQRVTELTFPQAFSIT
jgi:hypothetical protein